jgi:hypothetical protein
VFYTSAIATVAVGGFAVHSNEAVFYTMSLRYIALVKKVSETILPPTYLAVIVL